MSLNPAQLTSCISKLKQLDNSINVVASMAEQVTQQLANDPSVEDIELVPITRIREAVLKAMSRNLDLISKYQKELNLLQNA